MTTKQMYTKPVHSRPQVLKLPFLKQQDQCERYTLYYKDKNVKRKGSAKKTTNQCFSYYLF